MYDVLQVLTVIIVAVAMALPLAHALELPGKMRLDKETYYAVQSICSSFFSFGTKRSRLENETRPPDWTELRDRWEYSHVVRAVLSAVSFIALVIAVS